MKLHSTIIGEGKPFIILHGFLGMSDNWKTVGRKIAEAGYQVHLVDQRNHGKSPHSDDFNYGLMAADIEEYCKDHKLHDIILMGHSMGGKTAMLSATTHPDRLEKLIVVDIAPKYYAPHHQEILNGLTALDEATITSRGDADTFLAEFVSDMGIRMFLLKNLYWKTKEKLALKINLSSLRSNIEEIGGALPDNSTFNKPVLFVKGANSNYITDEDQQLIKSHFPNSSIRPVAKAGHWVHAENMDGFLAVVLPFL